MKRYRLYLLLFITCITPLTSVFPLSSTFLPQRYFLYASVYYFLATQKLNRHTNTFTPFLLPIHTPYSYKSRSVLTKDTQLQHRNSKKFYDVCAYLSRKPKDMLKYLTRAQALGSVYSDGNTWYFTTPTTTGPIALTPGEHGVAIKEDVDGVSIAPLGNTSKIHLKSANALIPEITVLPTGNITIGNPTAQEGTVSVLFQTDHGAVTLDENTSLHANAGITTTTGDLILDSASGSTHVNNSLHLSTIPVASVLATNLNGNIDSVSGNAGQILSTNEENNPAFTNNVTPTSGSVTIGPKDDSSLTLQANNTPAAESEIVNNSNIVIASSRREGDAITLQTSDGAVAPQLIDRLTIQGNGTINLGTYTPVTISEFGSVTHHNNVTFPTLISCTFAGSDDAEKVSLRGPQSIINAPFYLTLPNSTGLSGQVLQDTDGFGTLGWTDAILNGGSTGPLTIGTTDNNDVSLISNNKERIVIEANGNLRLKGGNIVLDDLQESGNSFTFYRPENLSASYSTTIPHYTPNTSFDIGPSTGSTNTLTLQAGGGVIANSPFTAKQTIYADGGIEASDTGGNDVLNIGTKSSTTEEVNIGTGSHVQILNIGTGSGVTTINIGGPGDTVNIGGDLVTVSTTTVEVEDKFITLNKGGALGSANNAGIYIEEADNIAGYFQVSNDRNSIQLKAPNAPGVLTACMPEDLGVCAFSSSIGFGTENFVMMDKNSLRYNTAVGHHTLMSVTSGENNTGIGYKALSGNSSTSSNTAVGSQALENNAGHENTAVGHKSGQTLDSTANNNTLIGYNAGSTLTTGTHNTFLGHEAGKNTTSDSSNNIYINHPGIATESDTIRIGTPNQQTTAYIACNSLNLNDNKQVPSIPTSTQHIRTALAYVNYGNASFVQNEGFSTVTATAENMFTLTLSENVQNFISISLTPISSNSFTGSDRMYRIHDLDPANQAFRIGEVRHDFMVIVYYTATA